MNVLINISAINYSNTSIRTFLVNSLKHLLIIQPQLTIYLSEDIGLDNNERIKTAAINLKSWLIVKLTLKSYIAKNEISQYVHVGENGFIPNNLGIPVALWLHAQLGTQLPTTFERKKKWSKLFSSVQQLVVATPMEEELLREQFTALQSFPITPIGVAVDDAFEPINDFEEKEAIKLHYSHEYDYILCQTNVVDDSETFIQLLKGFSLIKQRHRNRLQLMFLSPSFSEGFLNKLSTYKYRSDILMLEPNSEVNISKLTATALMVFDITVEGFATPVLEAMRSGVMVLTNTQNNSYYFAGDHVVYYTSVNAEEIFTLINKFYVDEYAQRRYIGNAFIHTEHFNYNNVAERLHKTLELT